MVAYRFFWQHRGAGPGRGGETATGNNVPPLMEGAGRSCVPGADKRLGVRDQQRIEVERAHRGAAERALVQHRDDDRRGQLDGSEARFSRPHLASAHMMLEPGFDRLQHRFEQIADESRAKDRMAKAFGKPRGDHPVEVGVHEPGREMLHRVANRNIERAARLGHDRHRRRPKRAFVFHDRANDILTPSEVMRQRRQADACGRREVAPGRWPFAAAAQARAHLRQQFGAPLGSRAVRGSRMACHVSLEPIYNFVHCIIRSILTPGRVRLHGKRDYRNAALPMTDDMLLRLAYGANILILLPVVTALLWSGTAAVFGPGVPESTGLRLLVAALWGAILLCSVIGLAWPRPMMGILLLQILYKTGWLLTFVLPAIRASEPVPWGPTLVFIPIILLWPLILIRVWL